MMKGALILLWLLIISSPATAQFTGYLNTIVSSIDLEDNQSRLIGPGANHQGRSVGLEAELRYEFGYKFLQDLRLVVGWTDHHNFMLAQSFNGMLGNEFYSAQVYLRGFQSNTFLIGSGTDFNSGRRIRMDTYFGMAHFWGAEFDYNLALTDGTNAPPRFANDRSLPFAYEPLRNWAFIIREELGVTIKRGVLFYLSITETLQDIVDIRGNRQYRSDLEGIQMGLRIRLF